MRDDDENEGRVGKCDREVTRTRRPGGPRYGRDGTGLTFWFFAHGADMNAWSVPVRTVFSARAAEPWLGKNCVRGGRDPKYNFGARLN